VLLWQTFESTGSSSSIPLITWTQISGYPAGSVLDGGGNYLEATNIPAHSITVVRFSMAGVPTNLGPTGSAVSMNIYMMDSSSIPLFTEPTEFAAYAVNFGAGTPSAVYFSIYGCVWIDSDSPPSTGFPYSWGLVGNNEPAHASISLAVESWAKP